MRAIVRPSYGSPDVLQLVERPTPTPGPGEVLVRVRAASANALDWRLLRPDPVWIRAFMGFGKPRDERMGVDFAGDVEALGDGVTDLAVGDAVFGAGEGSFAEFVCVERDQFAPKPEGNSYAEAAAARCAGITALQGLVDHGRLEAGQRVLIHGASGGVGTFAVQIAKARGAHVTAVCSTAKVELVQSLGADAVIDYKKQDFTELAERFDVLFDLGADRPLSACRRLLTPGGTYVLAGAAGRGWLGPIPRMIQVALANLGRGQRFVVLHAARDQKSLVAMAALLEEGSVRPVIEREYPLADTASAIRYLETRRARGKLVIRT